MSEWLVALLVVAVLLAFVWLARRRENPDEAERRRTAEERLRDYQLRNVRRRERKDEDW